MKEIDIQNQIRLELSKHGLVLRMNNGLFYTEDGRPIKSGLPRGTSDLLFIGQGFMAFLEVKTSKGIPSKEQLRFIDKINSLGHKAGIVRNVQDALDIINN